MVNEIILRKRKRKNENELNSIIETYGSFEDQSKKRYILISQQFTSRTNSSRTIKSYNRVVYLKNWLKKHNDTRDDATIRSDSISKIESDDDDGNDNIFENFLDGHLNDADAGDGITQDNNEINDFYRL